MIARPFAFALFTLLGGCGGYPRDTEGTLDRVRGWEMRVGLVEGGGDFRLDRLLDQLATATGSRVMPVRGAAEPLLVELEAGRLDLVVGRFDAKTPWETRVTFGKPVATGRAGDRAIEAKAAVRNGEHAWAMAVDRAVGDVTR